MSKQTNFLQKIGNFCAFKGSLNRGWFLVMFLLSILVYNALYDLALKYDFYLDVSRIYMGIVFCYLNGIVFAARLRYLKLPPIGAYFIVFVFWATRFVVLNSCYLSKMYRHELAIMLTLFIAAPLLVQDKKDLRVLSEEK